MTDHELLTLVRDHVADEPAFTHDLHDVVTQGRRTVRRRRRVAGLTGVAVLTLAAVALPQLRSGSPDADRVVDPAITRALDAYDPLAMPRTMDDRARPVLAASVPELGPADFVAFDDQGQQLPERYWDRASGLTTRYGVGSDHRVTVTLAHARGSAEGDPDRYCAEGLEAGYYLECAVERTADGDVAITTLGALRTEGGQTGGLQAWQDYYVAVTRDQLSTVRPDRLWFSRDVKVITSATFVTNTSETVRAPDLATARDLLVVPAADLESIGRDPALVMPTPPRGDHGCPQWTMPTTEMGEVSCTGTDDEPLVG